MLLCKKRYGGERTGMKLRGRLGEPTGRFAIGRQGL